MLIKEFARQTNLSAKTIRYYEEIDLLPPPARLQNGYRNYSETDVSRARFVAGARSLNFSLDDIQEILGLLIALLGVGAGKSLSISGADPNQFVRAFRGIVGMILLSLGIFQLSGRTLKPKIADKFAYQTRPQRNGRRSAVATLYKSICG